MGGIGAYETNGIHRASPYEDDVLRTGLTVKIPTVIGGIMPVTKGDCQSLNKELITNTSHMEISSEAQSMTAPDINGKRRAKWALILSPVIAFVYPLIVLVALIPWILIGDAPGSDSQSTIVTLAHFFVRVLFLDVRYPVLIILALAYYFYRRQNFSFSLILSVIAALAGVVLTSMIQL